MIRKSPVLAALAVVCLAMSMATALAVGPPEASRVQEIGGPVLRAKQDPNTVPRLEWTAPHGELPGTYAEYLAQHPLTSLQLKEISYGKFHTIGSRSISILVNTSLYPSITSALNTYKTDLESEGYTVYIATASGGTPASIKSWVQTRYQAGAEGILFIGNIPAAWYDVAEDEEWEFPCDLYYMDLDGAWTDTDSDGVFETHTAGTGDEGPEVYVARLYTPTQPWNTQANLVNTYLAKTHAYRLGTLTQPWRGLEYVDEDWSGMYVALDLVYGENIARYDWDSGHNTTGADYLNKLDLGQHFTQVCAHSYSSGHSFNGDDWVFSWDVQDRDPPCLFYNLFACSAGRFTDNKYLAGAYIFNTTYGLITVASSKSGSMLNFWDFTGPLSNGQSFGRAYRMWFDSQAPYATDERSWYYGMVLNGDPTLSLYTSVRTTAPSSFLNSGWNWFSIPLDPVETPEASSLLGFGCKNILYRWDNVRKNVELYPDDFQNLERGRGYLLRLDGNQQPSYTVLPPDGAFEIAIPKAGWSWIGQPFDHDTPLADFSIRNNTTGVTRTAQADKAAGSNAWANWNLLWWYSTEDSWKLTGFAGADDDTLHPWYGYLFWSNVDNLTLIVPEE